MYFSCPLYDVISTSIVNTGQTTPNVKVSTELSLFGSNNLRTDQNFTIIAAVHLFLNKSKCSLND